MSLPPAPPEAGARGFCRHVAHRLDSEHQVERHWRDARPTTTFEGTGEIQRKIIADRLLPRSPVG